MILSNKRVATRDLLIKRNICALLFGKNTVVLGKGVYGKVILSPFNKDRVFKIVKAKWFHKSEYYFGTILGNMGIAPKIYNFFECSYRSTRYKVIEMERITDTLKSWLQTRSRSVRARQGAYRNITTMIRKMHSNGIYHGDLHHQNIGRVGSRWVLLDFGWTHSKQYPYRKDFIQYLWSTFTRIIIAKPRWDNQYHETYLGRILRLSRAQRT